MPKKVKTVNKDLYMAQLQRGYPAEKKTDR